MNKQEIKNIKGIIKYSRSNRFIYQLQHKQPDSNYWNPYYSCKGEDKFYDEFNRFYEYTIDTYYYWRIVICSEDGRLCQEFSRYNPIEDVWEENKDFRYTNLITVYNAYSKDIDI